MSLHEDRGWARRHLCRIRNGRQHTGSHIHRSNHRHVTCKSRHVDRDLKHICQSVRCIKFPSFLAGTCSCSGKIQRQRIEDKTNLADDICKYIYPNEYFSTLVHWFSTFGFTEVCSWGWSWGWISIWFRKWLGVSRWTNVDKHLCCPGAGLYMSFLLFCLICVYSAQFSILFWIMYLLEYFGYLPIIKFELC